MTEGLNWWEIPAAQDCGVGGCLGPEGAEPWSGPVDACSWKCMFPATATSGVQDQGEMEGCWSFV